jgi:short-subunit dehydrogenase
MHVIITGGSSGIGLEIARTYACRGARVTLMARDRQRLDLARATLLQESNVATDNLHVVSVDVTRMQEVVKAFETAVEINGPCDVLVAAAGEVEVAMFKDMPADIFDSQIATNITGTANTVRACYGAMQARGEGKIMIIASAAGLIGIPGYTAYCASKSALTGFAEALAAESKGSGIEVMISYPPDTATPQYARERIQRSREAWLLVGRSRERPASEVARKIVRAIGSGTEKHMFGTRLRFLHLFGPLIKPIVYRWFHWRLRGIAAGPGPADPVAENDKPKVKTSGAVGGGTS